MKNVHITSTHKGTTLALLLTAAMLMAGCSHKDTDADITSTTESQMVTESAGTTEALIESTEEAEESSSIEESSTAPETEEDTRSASEDEETSEAETSGKADQESSSQTAASSAAKDETVKATEKPTEPAPQPTPAPTQPTPAPTQPAPKPTEPAPQPTPAPTQPAPKPTEPAPQPTPAPTEPAPQPTPAPTQPSDGSVVKGGYTFDAQGYCLEYSLEVFRLQNEARVQAGVQPLTWSDEIYDRAKQCAKAITTNFSHDASRPYTLNYHGSNELDENIYWGTCFQPIDVIDAYRGSPGHWLGVVSPDWDYGAVAVCYNPADGKLYCSNLYVDSSWDYF